MPIRPNINLSKLRHVGIMSVHNVTGDWERPFGVAWPTESGFNPSTSGVIFFRWHQPPGYSKEAAYNEIRFFKAADEILRSKGGRGLDAVIIFGDTGYRHTPEGLIIAEGVKEQINSDILVLATVYRHELPGPKGEAPTGQNGLAIQKAQEEGIIDVVISTEDDNAFILCKRLGLPVRRPKRWSSVRFSDPEIISKAIAIGDIYEKNFPEMFRVGHHLDPEKLAASVPALPKGRYQVAWEKGFEPRPRS